MPTTIAIEAKPVEFAGIESGFFHLYLVKTTTDSEGRVTSEKVIRGSLRDDGSLGTIAGADLASSPDRRGSDTPEDRHRRQLDTGSNDPDGLWHVMVQHATNIDRANFRYSADIFQEVPGSDLNSNSVVASVLHSVGLDRISPLPFGISRSEAPLYGQLRYVDVDDHLTGTSGKDRVLGGIGDDQINGLRSNDVLYGEDGNDLLLGSVGNDALSGGAGDDRLQGSRGNDKLRGGTGDDAFVFTTGPNSVTNIDTIRDFSVRDDTVLLENNVYKALGAAGRLDSAAFWTGSEAHDATDRIIYNRDEGILYYDRDGTGAVGQVAFAKLSAGLNLTYADFMVI